VVWIGLVLYFRLRVHNPHRSGGGYVLVANHTSFLDPIILGAANPGAVSFLINTISYRSPLAGWFFRLFRSIPVSPGGGNRQALREAQSALDAGEIVGVFPEGGISRDGRLMLGNPGAVALVLARNTSVVPVGLVGVAAALPVGARLPRPRRIEVRYGNPIPASELMQGADRKERLAAATLRIMREIATLTDQVAREDAIDRQIA
jgi:1-acyl-sn-glycerol-3-phosphate acyltransferase